MGLFKWYREINNRIHESIVFSISQDMYNIVISKFRLLMNQYQLLGHLNVQNLPWYQTVALNLSIFLSVVIGSGNNAMYSVLTRFVFVLQACNRWSTWEIACLCPFVVWSIDAHFIIKGSPLGIGTAKGPLHMRPARYTLKIEAHCMVSAKFYPWFMSMTFEETSKEMEWICLLYRGTLKWETHQLTCISFINLTTVNKMWCL